MTLSVNVIRDTNLCIHVQIHTVARLKDRGSHFANTCTAITYVLNCKTNVL